MGGTWESTEAGLNPQGASSTSGRAKSNSWEVGVGHSWKSSKLSGNMSPQMILTVHKVLALLLEFYGLLGNLWVQYPQLVQLIKVQPCFTEDVLRHSCSKTNPDP